MKPKGYYKGLLATDWLTEHMKPNSIEIIKSYIKKVENKQDISDGLKQQVKAIDRKARNRQNHHSNKDRRIRSGIYSDSAYDFEKPYQAQDLGPEWDDYAWSADDF